VRTDEIMRAASPWKQDWATVRELADPQVERMLRGWHGEFSADPGSFTCRGSAASRPARPITVCRFKTAVEDFVWKGDDWRIWYRKTSTGRRIAMKMSPVPNDTVYVRKAKLATRTEKLLSLAWDGQWDRVGQYVRPAALKTLKWYIDETQGQGARAPETDGICVNGARGAKDSSGQHQCDVSWGGVQAPDEPWSPHLIGYQKLKDGRWVITKITEIP